jgi:hypothetical protein
MADAVVMAVPADHVVVVATAMIAVVMAVHPMMVALHHAGAVMVAVGAALGAGRRRAEQRKGHGPDENGFHEGLQAAP